MTRLKNLTPQNRLDILDTVETLISAGYDPTLRVTQWDVSLQMFVDTDALPKIKALLNLPKINKLTYTDKSAMYAKAEVNKIEMTIWPRGDVFQGCRLEKEEIDVPEETIPAHKKIVNKVICGNGGD